MRILVAEHDRDFADRVQRIFDESPAHRFEVEVERDLESSLERLREGRFHAVILDLSLPDAMGLEALSRTQEVVPTLPIVVMTQRDDEDLGLQAVRAGAQDYLVKERWDSQVLVRTLRHAAERNRMVQELRENRRQQHYLATHDALTGLHNRSAFEDALQRAVAYSDRHHRRFAVFFLDLDGFKSINDSFGHAMGDEVLNTIGKRLSPTIRCSDVFARFGGDEFVALVQDLRRAEDGAVVAEAIMRSLEPSLDVKGREFRITASVGIAVFPDDALEPDSLIRSADIAMYYAKSRGRNRYAFFSRELRTQVAERVRFDEKIRCALDGDGLALRYQPVREARSGCVVRADAQVQWAEGDPFRSGDLLTAAEESGLVVELWEWAAKRVVEDWQRRSVESDSKISVCLRTSALQVDLGGVPEFVADLLDASGFDPRSLTLEFPAKAFKERGTAAAQLDRLHELGVGLCLADFGSGGSSLETLRRLPIQRVKMSRSFVAGLLSEMGDTPLVAAVIRLAHSLGKQVVATGVDSEEAVRILSERGCDELSGGAIGGAQSLEQLFEMPRSSATAAPSGR